MFCRNMCFSIYLTVYCLQRSERCQIKYLDNKLSIVQKYCNGQSICQSLALCCCLCLIGLSAYFLVQQTSFTLFMWLIWNLINLWHDEFTAMNSYVPYVRKNYPGSSIGRSLTCKQGLWFRSPPWVNDFWSVYKWRYRRDLHRSAVELL